MLVLFTPSPTILYRLSSIFYKMTSRSQTRNAKISENEWARHKNAILSLYLDEDINLEALCERMKDELGFVAR